MLHPDLWSSTVDRTTIYEAAYNPKIGMGAGGLTLVVAAAWKKNWAWWLVVRHFAYRFVFLFHG